MRRTIRPNTRKKHLTILTNLQSAVIKLPEQLYVNPKTPIQHPLLIVRHQQGFQLVQLVRYAAAGIVNLALHHVPFGDLFL